MSLEDALKTNTAALEKHSTLLEKLLASTGNATASAPAATETKAAPATKAAATKAAATAPADDGPSYEVVAKKAMAWVTETGKGSPEQEARSAYLKAEIWPKLGVASIKETEGKPDLIVKINNWLDKKSKTDILGYGAGIFAKPASDDGDAGGDEEEL
jgi:hypothetical protein